MNEIIEKFYRSLTSQELMSAVYTDDTASEMMKTQPDSSGWYDWKLVEGRLTLADYAVIEKQFKVALPLDFKQWHRRYYFADCDCSLIRLPQSLPNQPLKHLKNELDWQIAEQLIHLGLIPFGREGNDVGPLVFDTRDPNNNNDFSIRVYDHEYGGDLDGLSDVVFSSFFKLLECITHFLNERKNRKDFEVILEFFEIDKEGAGSSGRQYWNDWAEMLKENFEELGY